MGIPPISRKNSKIGRRVGPTYVGPARRPLGGNFDKEEEEEDFLFRSKNGKFTFIEVLTNDHMSLNMKTKAFWYHKTILKKKE